MEQVNSISSQTHEVFNEERVIFHTKSYLNHAPTKDQEMAIIKLCAFAGGELIKEVFILHGYAGTGKSTIFGALIRAMKKSEVNFRLITPTGQAAKILSS